MGVVSQTAAKLAAAEGKSRKIRFFTMDGLDLTLEAVYHVLLFVLELLLQLYLFLL